MHLPYAADRDLSTSQHRPTGRSLDQRFDGAWGSEQTPQQPGNSGQDAIFTRKVDPHGPQLAGQLAGPIGAARHMLPEDNLAQSNPSQTPAQPEVQDPALAPIQGGFGQRMSIPSGSTVPDASLRMSQEAQPRSEGGLMSGVDHPSGRQFST